MIQNYLGNVRRTIQRVTNFIDSRRTNLPGGPRQAAAAPPPYDHSHHQDPAIAVTGQFVEGIAVMRQSVLDRIQLLSKRVHDFTMQWTRAVGRQQSPLIDRIPPGGMHIWQDFLLAVRKQVRRINQEVADVSRDVIRMITGRFTRPPTDPNYAPQMPKLVYAALDEVFAATATTLRSQQPQDSNKRFQEFYEKMIPMLELEQRKLEGSEAAADEASLATASKSYLSEKNNNNNLIDEQDDEPTRNELKRNPALRQQIEHEISIFGSIFDILGAFLGRLRQTATTAIRDVMQPNQGINNDNAAVTPPGVMQEQVDKVLGETIESQRLINGQGPAVLLPNKRPTVNRAQG